MMKKRFLMLLVVVALIAPVGSDGRVLGQSEAPPEEGEALEEFVPSEEVSADRAISFPVDI